MPVVVHCIGFKLTQLLTKCMHFLHAIFRCSRCCYCWCCALSLLPAFVWLRCDFSTIFHGVLEHIKRIWHCVFAFREYRIHTAQLLCGIQKLPECFSRMFCCLRLTLAFDLHPGLYVGFCFHFCVYVIIHAKASQSAISWIAVDFVI